MKGPATLLAVVVAVAGTAGAAWAAWTIGSTDASGRGAARSLPAGPTPGAVADGSTVTVSFPQVSLGGSVLGALPGGGYTVRRYDSAGAAQAVAAGCDAITGSAPTLACAETGVAGGTWSYRVTPLLAGWAGADGPAVAVVVIAAPPDTTPPVVTVTLFTAAKGGNTKVTATGTATPGDGPVRVYVCRSSPCSAANAVNTADPHATVGLLGGIWTYTSANLGPGTSYLAAQQTDAAGNTGASPPAGPVTR